MAHTYPVLPHHCGAVNPINGSHCALDRGHIGSHTGIQFIPDPVAPHAWIDEPAEPPLGAKARYAAAIALAIDNTESVGTVVGLMGAQVLAGLAVTRIDGCDTATAARDPDVVAIHEAVMRIFQRALAKAREST